MLLEFHSWSSKTPLRVVIVCGFRGKNRGKIKEVCQDGGKSGNFDLKIRKSV
jgi:hypothetical protein